MPALHSAEFDDIAVNLVEDDSRMTNEGHRHRFVFVNILSVKPVMYCLTLRFLSSDTLSTNITLYQFE